MRFNLLALFAAALMLGACETAPEESAETSGSGSATSETVVAEVEEEVVEIPGPVAGSQEDLTVEVGDRVFYAFDSADLSPEAQETVERLAIWLDANPGVAITVQGNADNRGTREYNLALGERRATSVKNMLVALGIDPNRVDTISYGKERPAVLGDNDFAWAQNRRSQFVVN
ncbi:MAG: peptidoglycan-associated lipoprotein Pal [Pseudomonadota bacterium]